MFILSILFGRLYKLDSGTWGSTNISFTLPMQYMISFPCLLLCPLGKFAKVGNIVVE